MAKVTIFLVLLALAIAVSFAKPLDGDEVKKDGGEVTDTPQAQTSVPKESHSDKSSASNESSSEEKKAQGRMGLAIDKAFIEKPVKI